MEGEILDQMKKRTVGKARAYKSRQRNNHNVEKEYVL